MAVSCSIADARDKKIRLEDIEQDNLKSEAELMTRGQFLKPPSVDAEQTAVYGPPEQEYGKKTYAVEEDSSTETSAPSYVSNTVYLTAEQGKDLAQQATSSPHGPVQATYLGYVPAMAMHLVYIPQVDVVSGNNGINYPNQDQKTVPAIVYQPIVSKPYVQIGQKSQYQNGKGYHKASPNAAYVQVPESEAQQTTDYDQSNYVLVPQNYYQDQQQHVTYDKYSEPQQVSYDKYADSQQVSYEKYAQPQQASYEKYAEPQQVLYEKYAEPQQVTYASYADSQQTAYEKYAEPQQYATYPSQQYSVDDNSVSQNHVYAQDGQAPSTPYKTITPKYVTPLKQVSKISPPPAAFHTPKYEKAGDTPRVLSEHAHGVSNPVYSHISGNLVKDSYKQGYRGYSNYYPSSGNYVQQQSTFYGNYNKKPKSLLESYIPSSLQVEYLKRGLSKEPLATYDLIANSRNYRYEGGFLPNQLYSTANGGVVYEQFKRSTKKDA